MVSDLVGATVEHVADERHQGSLDGYFERLAPEQLGAIEAVAAVDMWTPT